MLVSSTHPVTNDHMENAARQHFARTVQPISKQMQVSITPILAIIYYDCNHARSVFHPSQLLMSVTLMADTHHGPRPDREPPPHSSFSL